MRRRRRRALVVAAILAAAGCTSRDEATPTDPPIGAVAPVHPAATLVIDTPLLALGDVVEAELAIVVPAGTRALPYTPPDLPGLWLLDREEEVRELADGRWVHRTRFRVRARALGSHSWPASRVAIEDASGEAQQIDVPGIAYEVMSTVAAFPERDRPFGVLPPPDRSGGGFDAGSFAAGALSVAAIVGLAAVARRRRARSAHDPGADATAPPATTDPDLESFAKRELDEVRDLAQHDALAAADRAAWLLRRIVGHRFRVEAMHATREQLAEIRVPLAGKRHWPELMRMLRDLDALRFRPNEPDEVRSRLEACLRDIEAFASPNRTSSR